MRGIIHNIINLINEINEKDIKQLSNEFIAVIKNETIQEVDYELTEQLFVLDLSLSKKSNAFWSLVSENDEISNLPNDLRDYICIVLKDKPVANISSYRKKIEGCGSTQVFKYLRARCLIQEGKDSENKVKVEEGEGILETLMWQTDKEPGNSYNYDQLVNARIEALFSLTRNYPFNEAVECIEEIRNLKNKNVIFDPLYVYQESLIALNNAREELDKNITAGREEFKTIADSYQTKNMEIISVFIAIVALIFAGGAIVYKANSLNDQLILLGALSLNVVAVLAIMLSMLRFKRIALTINLLILIVSFGSGYYFWKNNNKANITQPKL